MRPLIHRRFLSHRPALYEVIPKKKIMNRILFDLDSKHPFSKLYPVYESIYKNLDTSGDAEIPSRIDANDLMVMKRALETIRTQTHTTNKHLLSLENSLVEYAAERGNNDAVSLLAYEALLGKDEDDKKHAKKLISGLLELKHPLTMKLSGDLCLKNGLQQQAEKFYLDFIELEDDTFLASDAFRQLGILNFQKPDLIKARHWFERSVRTGPVDKVAECHFYLGQLYAYDPKKSRYHLETAASQAFKESFKQLGFLELNQFGNILKAKEWFKLGVELGDYDSVVGIFDCFMSSKEYKKAYGAYNTLKQDQSTFSQFEKSRENAIALMNANYAPLKKTIEKIKEFKEISTTVSDRWNA
jgi:protein MSS2